MKKLYSTENSAKTTLDSNSLQNTDKYSVSIIVPVYNVSEFISRSLDCLIGQTLKNIEIIVIDDGSTDNTTEIVNKYVQTDSRIKLVLQEHLKQGAARNNGTRLAKGEYIGFVDADDWVDLDFFEKLYITAKKYDSDIALATNIRIGNGITKKRLNINEEKFVTTLQDKIDIGKQAKNPCPTNKIYKRELLEKNSIAWPEGVYCEDKLFTLKAVYYANGIVAVPNINYYYFRNPHSTVNNQCKKLAKIRTIDKENARLEVINFLREKNADIRDNDFLATTKTKSIFGITYYKEKQSLHTIRYYLFFIKIFEKKL